MTRKEVCEFIIENYDLFKVCECCDSILTKKASICPVCKSYRFEQGKTKIISRAKKFKNKPRTCLLDCDFI